MSLVPTGGFVGEVRVTNKDSALDLLVNIPAIHGESDDVLGPGETEYYRSDTDIKSVVLNDDSGGAIDYEVSVTYGNDESTGYAI